MKGKIIKILLYFIVIIIALSGLTIIFFNMPYSAVKKEFEVMASGIIEKADGYNEVFTEEDIADLPGHLQNYFRNSGFLGKPKMAFMKMSFKDAVFSTGKDKPEIKLDGTIYSSVNKPDRAAYLNGSINGIPFERIDSLKDGEGFVKEIMAKMYTSYFRDGYFAEKVNLASYLTECFLMPNALLQGLITWDKEYNDFVFAAATYNDVDINCSFQFNEEGELLSFSADSKIKMSFDDGREAPDWKVYYSDYNEKDGIKLPSEIKFSWGYWDNEKHEVAETYSLTIKNPVIEYDKK